MGSPLFAAIRLLDPLQHAAASFRRLFRHQGALPMRPPVVSVPARAAAHAALPACSRPRPPRRLRVVRVLESPQAAANAGRMVISGRMADVCAELERLAALETAAG